MEHPARLLDHHLHLGRDQQGHRIQRHFTRGHHIQIRQLVAAEGFAETALALQYVRQTVALGQAQRFVDAGLA